MDIIEIYEALRQITYAKAQILQKFCSVKYETEGMREEKDDEAEQIRIEMRNKQRQLNQKKERRDEIETRLREGLMTLRKEEIQIRELKNRRVQQRMQLMNKRKQLEIKLELQRNPGHQNLKRVRESRSSFLTSTSQNNQKLKAQLSEMQTKVQEKQKQLRQIESQIEINKEGVSLIFKGYQKLQDSILERRKQIDTIKKKVKESQFELEKLKIENEKLKKEALLTKKAEHSRNCLSKISVHSQMNLKIKAICNQYIESTEDYGKQLQKIKAQLQI